MVWKVQIQQLTLAGEDTTLLFAQELLDAGFSCSTRDMRRETNSVQKLKLSLSFRLSTFDPLAHRSRTYSNRDFGVLLYRVLSSFSAPVAINHIHQHASRILPCICTPFLSRIGLLPSVDTHTCIPTFTHWSVRFGVLHPESLRGGLFRYSFSRSYIFASNLLETQRLNVQRPNRPRQFLWRCARAYLHFPTTFSFSQYTHLWVLVALKFAWSTSPRCLGFSARRSF